MAMTIEQIANNLGVSITTVKLVYNGKADKYRISTKTQSRVLNFIEEHGITVNQTARNLKLKKTNTLGLVVPRITNIFFSSLIECLEKECNKSGFQLITASSYDRDDKETEVTRNLIERGVDGLFIVPNSKQQQKDTIKKYNNKPIIFLDRDYQIENQSTIVSDNYQGFLEITDQILAKQVSEIYVISGDCNLPSIRSRLQGFIDSYKNHNLSPVSNWLHAVTNSTFEDGYNGMQSLFEELNRFPESIVFSSLPILEGALHFIKSHKGTIPTSVIIGTFDDHTMLEFLPNSVISAKQDAVSIAKNACSLIGEQIDNKENINTKLVIPTTLIIRN
ncbi:substrate-binding domain-containing protein [Vibrio kasasachensis]|uniref:substrate-binding domain-containing protein n=1 Tax=Vibrio kasasachensis TaxID=2910248 RepID=UPI003D0DA08A